MDQKNETKHSNSPRMNEQIKDYMAQPKLFCTGDDFDSR